MKTLIPIGGNINKKEPRVLLEFIRRAGGRKARIAVLPQASSLADTGEYYAAWFKKLGAGAAESLEFSSRVEATRPDLLRAIRKASGIFIGGGNQARIPVLISGTPLEAALLEAYQRGCVIGGTSAGAAVLSKVMLAYGKSGATPRAGIAQFSPGIGFTDQFVFDQHFRQRDRLGRLIYAVSLCPGVLGIGVDEDTAAIIEDETRLTVLGSGAATIVDGSRLDATDAADIPPGRPIAAANLTVHVLTDGCVFDGKRSKISIPKKSFLS